MSFFTYLAARDPLAIAHLAAVPPTDGVTLVAWCVGVMLVMLFP